MAIGFASGIATGGVAAVVRGLVYRIVVTLNTAVGDAALQY
jgi:hypothetical protein